jgi:transposase, IS6 family
MYLYRAVDSEGNTVEFMLSPSRNATSAKRFFRKVLRAGHTVPPRVINVDKNPAYPTAIGKLKKHGILPPNCELRPVKYLNNLIEQDHRFICGVPTQAWGSGHLRRRGERCKGMRQRTNYAKGRSMEQQSTTSAVR